MNERNAVHKMKNHKLLYIPVAWFLRILRRYKSNGTVLVWLWRWYWRLTELRPLLRAFCSFPDENERMNEWKGEWMNEMDEWKNYFFLILGKNVELTVESYWQGKTEGLGEKPVPLDWPGREPGPPRWEAGD
jgi:hypothetical protein